MAMKPTDPTYKLDGHILRTSDKAILFEVHKINGAPYEPTLEADDADTKEVANPSWFPISQVAKTEPAINPDDLDTIYASKWITETKGFV